MVKHGIRQLERLHLALWIPDAQIGILAREDNPLLRKTVELGGIGAADSHEVLDGDLAIQDALVQQGLASFQAGQTVGDLAEFRDAVDKAETLAALGMETGTGLALRLTRSGSYSLCGAVIGRERGESAIRDGSPHGLQVFGLLAQRRGADAFGSFEVLPAQSFRQEVEILRAGFAMNWEQSGLRIADMTCGDLGGHMDEQNRRVHQFGKRDRTVLFVPPAQCVMTTFWSSDTYSSFRLGDFWSRHRVIVRVIVTVTLQRFNDPSDVSMSPRSLITGCRRLTVRSSHGSPHGS